MEDNLVKMFLTHFTNVGIFNFVGLLLIFSKAVTQLCLRSGDGLKRDLAIHSVIMNDIFCP